MGIVSRCFQKPGFGDNLKLKMGAIAKNGEPDTPSTLWVVQLIWPTFSSLAVLLIFKIEL